MRIRSLFIGLLSLFLALGCDDAAEGPSGSAATGPGSISGSYNPDGVVAVISGQVLLQAAAEGAHNGTQVAVRGYSSTATTNAEGLFRLELILAEEDIARTDADSDTPLSVAVIFSHPGYSPSQMMVTVAPGEAVALDAAVTLEVILATVRGRLAFPVGLVPLDFADQVSLSLSPSAGAAQTTTYDENGAFEFTDLLPETYTLTVEGGPFNRSERSVSVGPGDRSDVGDTPVQLKESERLNYETAIEGVVKLQGVTDDNAHGGIRVESVGTAFATVTASSGRFRLPTTPGTQTLQFSYAGYGTQTLEVPEVAARQSTRLSEAVVLTARPGRITGTVRLNQYETSLRLQTVDVTLVDGNDADVLTVTPNAAGRFTFDDVTPGEWRVQASRSGYESRSSFVMVDAGQSVSTESLLLPHNSTTAAAVRFTGSVTLADTADGSGTLIRLLMLPDALPAGEMLTIGDGSFDLPAAVDERYEVQVVRPRFEVPQGWGPFTHNGTAFVDENGNPATIELAAFAGPEGDADGDGIPNGADNCPNLVNPLQADHEGDGIGDLCDPDDDNDGLNDAEEVLLGTDPLLADTDGDGLNDLFEQRGQTNPLNPDTDGDGEPDGLELTNLESPEDLDEDGLWDAVESSIRDDDGDGASDELDGPGPLGDRDGDGILNGLRDGTTCIDPAGCDNCFNTPNVDQLNTDGDAKGDACDTDDDDDGEPDNLDNCRLVVNVEQIDTDSDTRGDACDLDDDGDGLSDLLEAELGSNPLLADTDGDSIPDGIGDGLVADNCIAVRNMDQADHEGDGIGDACDPDDDNDGALDAVPADSVALPDNCPFIPNVEQLNTDGDTFGNACDVDDDNDSVLDIEDNCPLNVNPLQSDYDIDGSGDACDDDDDQDGVDDDADNCPFTFNSDQADTSGDGVGDLCSNDIDTDGVVDGRDNCIEIPNANQRDIDADGVGDACDLDIDGDGLVGANDDGLPDVDNCDAVYNPRQLDLDGDGLGDLCDLDDDGDGIADADDSCPFVTNLNSDLDADNIDVVCDNCPEHFNIFQRDLDGDGAGDACDDDDDDDQIPDTQDNCPNKPNFDQVDRDGDGRGDACSVFLVNHLPDHNIQDMASDADSVWIASTGGMTHWLYNHQSEEYTTTRHTTASGMPGNHAYSVDIDGNGNPYVLIAGVGLYVYIVAADEWRLIPLTLDDVGDCAVTPTSQMVDVTVNRTTGTIYVSFKEGQNNGGGVVHGTPGNWSCWPRRAGIPDGEVKRVELAPNGDVWVITDFGLGRYRQSDQWARFTPPGRLPSPTVHGIGFIGDDVWVSTAEGGVVIRSDDSRDSFRLLGATLKFAENPEEQAVVLGFGEIEKTSYNKGSPNLGPTSYPLTNNGVKLSPRAKVWVYTPHGDWWFSSEDGLREEPFRWGRREIRLTDSRGVARENGLKLGPDGKCYAAYEGHGVFSIDPNNLTAEKVVSDSDVEALEPADDALYYLDEYRHLKRVEYGTWSVSTVWESGPCPESRYSMLGLSQWGDYLVWGLASNNCNAMFKYSRTDGTHEVVNPSHLGFGFNRTYGIVESALGTYLYGWDTGHGLNASGPGFRKRIGDEWLSISNGKTTDNSVTRLMEYDDQLVGSNGDSLFFIHQDGTSLHQPRPCSVLLGVVQGDVWCAVAANLRVYRRDGVALNYPGGMNGFGGIGIVAGTAVDSGTLLLGGISRAFHLQPSFIARNYGVPIVSMPHFLTGVNNKMELSQALGDSYVVSPDGDFSFRGRDGVFAKIWLEDGTSAIARADGLQVRGRRLRTVDGLASDSVNDVAQSASGTIWAATVNGLSRLVNGEFTTFDIGNVRRVLVDREDRVWGATTNGLFVYSGVGFDRVSGLPGENVQNLTIDNRGTMWAATTNGLGRRTGASSFTSFDLVDGNQPHLTSVDTLLDGRVIVGSREQGVFIIHPNGIVDNLTVENGGLPHNKVHDVFAEKIPDGKTWIATEGGLSEYVAPPGVTDTPFCGDGLVAATEECDDGGVQTARCEADCTLPVCGDGVVNGPAGENCDDGNDDDSDDCPGSCKPAFCGDGYTSAVDEVCDDAGDSAECDADCSLVECGDGYLNLAVEECEPDLEWGVDGCTQGCSLSFIPQYERIYEGGGIDGARWKSGIGEPGPSDTIIIPNVPTRDVCAYLCHVEVTFECVGFMYKFSDSWPDDWGPGKEYSCTLLSNLEIRSGTFVRNLDSCRMSDE